MFDAATNLIGLFFETAIFDTANIQSIDTVVYKRQHRRTSLLPNLKLL